MGKGIICGIALQAKVLYLSFTVLIQIIEYFLRILSIRTIIKVNIFTSISTFNPPSHFTQCLIKTGGTFARTDEKKLFNNLMKL